MVDIVRGSRDFPKAHMMADEYRRAIADLGLNQGQAADFLGISPRTGRAYAADGPPHAHAMLLRLMVASGIMPDAVVEITKDKARARR